jgi:hypothetical protein
MWLFQAKIFHICNIIPCLSERNFAKNWFIGGGRGGAPSKEETDRKITS